MMQFKPVMMIGGAVLCLAAFEPVSLLAKAAYALVGAAAGACVADPLESEARNLGLQMKAMKQNMARQNAAAESHHAA